MVNDVSPLFRWNVYDAVVAAGIAEREQDPAQALSFFYERRDGLTNYAYWFFLSTLWVMDARAADLETWKALFTSERPQRNKSIMKPSEIQAFERLPYFVRAYRAHRAGEMDWIAYSIDPAAAKRLAGLHGAQTVNEYRIKKRDILALFLRRRESEIIMLNRERAEFIKTIGLEEIE